MTSSTSDGSSPGSRRRAFALVIAALASIAIGLLVLTLVDRGPGDPVDEAIAVARSEDGYDTGLEAGRTLARVASSLNRGIRSCDRATEPNRCATLGAASGYVQVAAASVVRCTAPGRIEARQAVLELLEDVRAHRPGEAPPPTPPLPTCRG